MARLALTCLMITFVQPPVFAQSLTGSLECETVGKYCSELCSVALGSLRPLQDDSKRARCQNKCHRNNVALVSLMDAYKRHHGSCSNRAVSSARSATAKTSSGSVAASLSGNVRDIDDTHFDEEITNLLQRRALGSLSLLERSGIDGCFSKASYCNFICRSVLGYRSLEHRSCNLQCKKRFENRITPVFEMYVQKGVCDPCTVSYPAHGQLWSGGVHDAMCDGAQLDTLDVNSACFTKCDPGYTMQCPDCLRGVDELACQHPGDKLTWSCTPES